MTLLPGGTHPSPSIPDSSQSRFISQSPLMPSVSLLLSSGGLLKVSSVGGTKGSHAGEVLSQMPHIHSKSLVKNRSFCYRIETPLPSLSQGNSLRRTNCSALKQKSAHFFTVNSCGPRAWAKWSLSQLVSPFHSSVVVQKYYRQCVNTQA